MKPGLLLSAIALVTIIVVASFGLRILPPDAIVPLPDSANPGDFLWVCPSAHPYFDRIALFFSNIQTQMNIAFFFGLLFVILAFAWALYQNLLKDKFEPKPYETAWFFTKVLFWIAVVATVLMHAPNHYRTVKIDGRTGTFVTCNMGEKNAEPVPETAVHTAR